MGYVKANLMGDEEITYQTKLHWIIFLWPLFWLVSVIIMCMDKEFIGFASILFFVFLYSVIRNIVLYVTSEFAVTNKRVIMKTGFIRRSSLEILISKVESIGVDQGILGRILGFGTINVIGSGGSKNPFKKICEPLKLRNQVNEQII
ncbi:PH domain-containing protein [Candidatus Latescibacterota bacterium]